MSLSSHRRGASTLETLLTAAFIALVMLAAVSLTGNRMRANFGELQSEARPAPPPPPETPPAP
jgi:Flp pilus assembly pilin Flp